LFKYRITPHTVTGVAPAELLMGRRLRSCLDVLKPDLTETVQGKQLKQKLLRDNGKSFRKFSEGDPVYIEDFSHAKPKWVSGTIQKPTGPASYSIILSDGNIVKRYVDNIKVRYNATANEPNESEFDLPFQSEPEPTKNTQPANTPNPI